MKKLLRIFSILVFMGVSWGAGAQTSVTIGSLDGAGNNSYLPMNSYYDYSYSQQIYTAAEIGMPGTITAVTMWLYGNSNLYEMPFDIYMKEVDKDAFSSTEDWVAVTASDIVYTGSVTVHNTDAQAYTFELTTPFAYSGSGNLLICFNNRTGQWAEGLNGKVFGAEGDAVRAIYARRDGTVYDPANLPAATLTTYQRNVVGLTIYVNGSFCFPPDNLAAVFTPGYSTLATLSWNQLGVAGSWVVEYGTASDFAGATQLTVSGTPSVALTALTAETTYYARVKAVCDVDEESDWSTTLTFTPLNSLLVSEPDTLDIGNRPAGAWMRPYRFTFGALVDGTQVDGMTIQGSGSSAIGLDSSGVTFPFSQNVGERMEFGITWGNEAAAVDGTVEVAYQNSGNVFSHDIVVRGNVYTPAVGDVWETAATVGTFPYTEDLNTATKPLYNNYQLPEEKIPDGKDVVYRLVFDQDVALSSRVTTGDHGKVALYSEGFAGVGGPDTGNIGKAEPPFEVQIGAGTNTTGYFPFYTLYNYSIAECLYRAAELEAAGVNTSPMTSLSWYATNSPGYEQQGISIWMANVSDNGLAASSHPVGGMTLVYTGNVNPQLGWNEFVFNFGSFAWDGSSNILIVCQRNNGNWNSSVQWQCGDVGFTAMAYKYQDSGPYDVNVSNGMFTSNNRPNIIMKSEGGAASVVYTPTVHGHGGSFEAQIGDGSSTSGYLPFYCFYNYSMSQQLFRADELVNAGAAAGEIGGFSWYCTATNGRQQSNISIWVANVDQTEVSASSPLTNTMTKVYEGAMTPAVGWNEFDFNTGNSFAWDGHSNLLICIQRNNGAWASGISWQIGTQSFNAGAYKYNDNSPYDMENSSYDDMTVTTNRANIIIKANSYAPDSVSIDSILVTPGIYYLAASSTSDNYSVLIDAVTPPCPESAVAVTPADSAMNVGENNVGLRWELDRFASQYTLLFGTDSNAMDTLVAWTRELKKTKTIGEPLRLHTTYYWQVGERNDGCPAGVMGKVFRFTTVLNPPTNLASAENGVIFVGDTLHLSWAEPRPVGDVLRYNIYRYNSATGAYDSIGTTTDTSYIITDLENITSGGNPYQHVVTAIYSQGESSYSNTNSITVYGIGTIEGYVYDRSHGTPVAGAEIKLRHSTKDFVFVTDGDGAFSGNFFADNYPLGRLTVSATGYVSVVYDSALAVSHGDTLNNNVFYLRPIDTVARTLDVAATSIDSITAKVEWLEHSVVEGFETGNFAQFDWCNDTTYPWLIDNTHATQGGYCMKSGNAGVDSTMSSMELTVYLPAKGDIRFYSKISSDEDKDTGYFFIDNDTMVAISGNGDWTEQRIHVPAGVHTLAWRYKKGVGGGQNDDCFYVDSIAFFAVPSASNGWHTYAGGLSTAYCSNVGTIRWGYEYPADFLKRNYIGSRLTKVSLYSDGEYVWSYGTYGAVGGNYTCTIYVGGNEPMAGTAVSTITVDVPRNQNAWVDFDLTTPVVVTGEEPIWVVWTANTSTGYYPAGCSYYGSSEGSWVNWGLENGYSWEKYGGVFWTMRQFFETDSIVDVALDYSVYRASCNGDNAECIADRVVGREYVDSLLRNVPIGLYKYGVKNLDDANSPIFWSNCIEGGRNVDTITVTVSPASGGYMNVDGIAVETFENYTVGGHVAVEAMNLGHNYWTTWNRQPGSGEDATVANFDGRKCMHIANGNDHVLLLGDKTSGHYNIEFDMYVPTGSCGYFNILHDFAGSSSTWAAQIYLNAINNTSLNPGHGAVYVSGNGTADIPCVVDAWMHFRVDINIDSDSATLYYTAPGAPETRICQWQWSLESSNGNYYGPKLAAVDFYRPIDNTEFYVDNVTFPGVIQVASREYQYFRGDSTDLAVNLNPCYHVAGWSKDGVDLSNDDDTLHVLVDGNASYVVHLELPDSLIGDTTASEYDSFTWHGHTYTESGDYADTLTAVSGCDSAVTLHLTVIPTNTITLAVNDATMGSVTLLGVLSPQDTVMPISLGNNSYRVLHGSNVVIQATANQGFHLAGWSDDAVVNADGTDTVIVNDDMTLTALFAIDAYDITVDVDDATKGSATVSYNGVSGNSLSVNADSLCTLTATPNLCYHFTAWTKGTDTVSTDASYSFTVTEDAEFVAHFERNAALTGDTMAVVCDSFSWYGATYTAPPTVAPTHDLLTAAGCDSTVTLHLTINNSNTGDTTAVACDSFSWWNTDYTNSTDNATHLFTNAAGCDSTVTLHLTVNYSNTGDTTAVACDSFTWWNTDYTNSTDNATHLFTNSAGCDSTVTLHLTVNYSNTGDTTAVACDSFTWWNTDYTNSTDNATHLFTNAAGCDSTVTLHLTINNSNIGDTTAVACDSFTWWNTDYTNSTDNATHLFTNAAGCDSTVTLHLTINNSNSSDTTTVACNSFTWYGVAYSQSAEPTQVFTNAAGCDSTVTLHLTVNYSNTGDTTAVVCDSLTWYGVAYSQSAEPTQVFTNVAGCDSTVTLHLTINNSNTGDTTAVACDGFSWYGVDYGQSAEPTQVFTNAAGCDSTVTLHLTVNYSNTGVETVTACNNYVWHGVDYTASTDTATFTETNDAGCDSVVTLNLTINYCSTTTLTVCDSYEWAVTGLTYTEGGTYIDGTDTLVLTVNYSTTSTTPMTVCDSVVWNNQTYTQSGNYTYSTTNAAGCDSTATLNLTVNYSTTSTTPMTVCDSVEWNNETYAQSGNYTYSTTNAAGCDSTATLELTVNYSTASTTPMTVCDSVVWNNQTYTQSGTYTYSTTNAAGCDSTATLELTVNYSTASTTPMTVCDSVVWNNETYTQSGNYTYSTTNAADCDSTATLDLTVNYSNTGVETITACNNYVWHGVDYTASTDTATFTETNDAGCDSVVTLNLTINYCSTTTLTVCDSYEWAVTGLTYTEGGTYIDGTDTLVLTVNYSTTSTTPMTVCDSVVWNNQTYAQSGNYTYSTTNVAGCDSTATLNLTVNYSNSGDTTVVACDSFGWYGVAYSQSAEPTQLFTNAAGCDSTVTLHLTVNYSNAGDTTAVVCDSLTWYGVVYSQSAEPTHVFTNAVGCDSTVTLHLTVNYSNTGDTTAVVCDSLTWYGVAYSQSAEPTQVFTNAAGCDSTVTLHLTVNYSYTIAVSDSAIGSYVWDDSTYYGSGVYTHFYTAQNGCDSTVTLTLRVDTIWHTVTLNYDTMMGSVSGAGLYADGSIATVVATPNEGYVFIDWADAAGATLSTESSYSFAVDADVTLQARFMADSVTFIVSVNNEAMGTTNPAPGVYRYAVGDSAYIVALPNDSYHFHYWKVSAMGIVDTFHVDGYGAVVPAELRGMTIEVKAYFAKNVYRVTGVPNDSAMGVIYGSNVYAEGDTASLTAMANSGYRFVGWSNGETTSTIRFVVTEDVTLTAYFEIFDYVVDIEDAELSEVDIYAVGRDIWVNGANGRDVYVFDVNGRMMAMQRSAGETATFRMRTTGVYLVKVGDAAAKRVMVMR